MVKRVFDQHLRLELDQEPEYKIATFQEPSH